MRCQWAHLAIERLLARLRACHPHRIAPNRRILPETGRLYCRTAVCTATDPIAALLPPPPPPPPPPPLLSLPIRLSSLRRSRRRRCGFGYRFPLRFRCGLSCYRLPCSCCRCFRLSRRYRPPPFLPPLPLFPSLPHQISLPPLFPPPPKSSPPNSPPP